MARTTSQLEFIIKARDDATAKIKKIEASMTRWGKATSAVRRAMSRLSKATSKIGRGVKALLRPLRTLQGQLLAIAGVAGVAGIAKSFISAASSMEQYAIQIGAVSSSQKQANELMAQAQEIALTIPFTLQDVMMATQLFRATTADSAEEVKELINLAADLASVHRLTFQEAVVQIGRVSNAGIQASELFRDRGIKNALGFLDGVAMTGAQTKKQLLEIWNDAEKGFRGASQKMAKTWVGVMSMISDIWLKFRTAVLTEDVFGRLVEQLNIFRESFAEFTKINSERLESIGSGIASVIKAFAGDIGKGADSTLNKIVSALVETDWDKVSKRIETLITIIKGGLLPIRLMGETVIFLADAVQVLSEAAGSISAGRTDSFLGTPLGDAIIADKLAKAAHQRRMREAKSREGELNAFAKSFLVFEDPIESIEEQFKRLAIALAGSNTVIVNALFPPDAPIAAQKTGALFNFIKERGISFFESMNAAHAKAQRIRKLFSIFGDDKDKEKVLGFTASLNEAIGVTATLTNAFRDSMAGAFAGLIDGTKSASEAMQSFAKGFINALVQMAAQILATIVLMAILMSLASFGGASASIAASIANAAKLGAALASISGNIGVGAGGIASPSLSPSQFAVAPASTPTAFGGGSSVQIGTYVQNVNAIDTRTGIEFLQENSPTLNEITSSALESDLAVQGAAKGATQA